MAKKRRDKNPPPVDHCRLPEGFEIESGMVWEGNPLDRPDLGPCCACNVTPATALITIKRRALDLEHAAWGCFVCGIGAKGACVELCDDCRRTGAPVKLGCRGRPGVEGRAPIEEFTEFYDHDRSKHPELAIDNARWN